MLGSVMPHAFGVFKSIRFRLTSKQHYLSGVLDFQSICQPASNGEFHYFEQAGEGRRWKTESINHVTGIGFCTVAALVWRQCVCEMVWCLTRCVCVYVCSPLGHSHSLSVPCVILAAMVLWHNWDIWKIFLSEKKNIFSCSNAQYSFVCCSSLFWWIISTDMLCQLGHLVLFVS